MVLCSALLAACATRRPPELAHSVSGRNGTVWAAQKHTAEELHVLLDRLAPRVRSVLPGSRDDHVDLRIVASLARSSWAGATYHMPTRRWIELPEGVRASELEATLAHELVHYWLGVDWSTLPAALEEGLADVVAHRCVPSAAAYERAHYAVVLASLLHGALRFEVGDDEGLGSHVVSVEARGALDPDRWPGFERALTLSSSELERLSASAARGTLDALGYLLASRIGIEELAQLCRRARAQGLERVPADWIWTMAGVDPASTTSFDAAIAALFGPEERRALLLDMKSR